MPTVRTRRHNDEAIMDKACHNGHDRRRHTCHNRCRLYLQVESIADITNARGNKIQAASFSDPPHVTSQSTTRWPKQGISGTKIVGNMDTTSSNTLLQAANYDNHWATGHTSTDDNGQQRTLMNKDRHRHNDGNSTEHFTVIATRTRITKDTTCTAPAITEACR